MAALFLRALTTACVVSVLLAVLLFPARQWMVRRYAPQVRWGLWCGMAALLLLGVCFSGMAAVPETVWNVPDYTVTLPAQGSPAVGQAAPEAAPSPAETAPSVSPAAPETSRDTALEEAVPQQTAEPPAKRTVSLIAAAGALWLTVAACIAARQGIRYGRMRNRLLSGSAPTAAFHQEIRQMGIKASIRILPGLACPMALGVFRPVVFLPSGQVPLLAVRHELTHVKRRDLAGKALLFLVCALYWFDPLVWHMARVAGEDMEAACDAQLAEDMTAAEKRAYGELLLSAAAGESAPPLSTRFGGSKAQMKNRLTQLFCPGKPSRILAGILLCAAFLVTGLVACQSISQADTAASDGVVYAVFDSTRQPEDTDYRELTLDLVDFSPGAGWVGGSSGTVTLPVSEDVRLSGRSVSQQTWKKDLMNFLYAPYLRSYALPGTADVLRAEVHSGVITAMDWYEGAQPVGGVLWQDADYGQFLPYVLRLPESWRDGFYTVAALGRDGQNRITDYAVEFYRTSTRELLFTLEAQKETEFRDRYGYDDTVLDDQGIRLLGSGDGWCFCGKASAAAEDDMLADLLAQTRETTFAWLGWNAYTSARHGFTLSFPDSWQNHFSVEETLRGAKFYCWPGNALLCSLEVCTEPMPQEELDRSGAELAGSGNGWYVYLSVPQSAPADQFEDKSQELRYQRMYQDFLRLCDSQSWALTFAQGDDAVYPALPIPVEPGAETRAAFAQVLRNLTGSGILPDGTQLEPWALPADFSENSFAVADVDGDGKEELILYFVTSDTAGMQGAILGYDQDRAEVHIQLIGFPSMEFYENGAVKVLYSHNQIGGALWPYTLYTYQPQGDIYQPEAIVYSWEKRIHPTNDAGQPFPDQLDRSKTGVIYYVEPDGWDDSNPMDQEDYLTWEAEALEGSAQLTLPFVPLTEENIAALEA